MPIPAYLANGLPFLHTYTYECQSGFVSSYPTQQMTVSCRSDGALTPNLRPQCVGMFTYTYLYNFLSVSMRYFIVF